jgi:hypothetical protein
VKGLAEIAQYPRRRDHDGLLGMIGVHGGDTALRKLDGEASLAMSCQLPASHFGQRREQRSSSRAICIFAAHVRASEHFEAIIPVRGFEREVANGADLPTRARQAVASHRPR